MIEPKASSGGGERSRSKEDRAPPVVDLRANYRALVLGAAEQKPSSRLLDEVREKIFCLASDIEATSRPAAMLLRAVAESIVDDLSTEGARSRLGRIPSDASAARFLDGNDRTAIDRFAEQVGMSTLQLMETAGVGPDVPITSKAKSRLTEMLEIIGRIAEWAGGERQAMAWYRSQPISALGGRTAESLVKSGRAAELRDYLDYIAVGGYA